MKQGGTAGIPSLTKVYFVKDFFIAMNKIIGTMSRRKEFGDDQTNIRRSDAVSEGL